MMPPHVTATEPANGGTLQGDTIVVRGHTLSILGRDEFELTDEAGRPVPFTLEVAAEMVGEGDLPGSVQERSVARLRIARPKGRYRLRVLGLEIGFVAGD